MIGLYYAMWCLGALLEAGAVCRMAWNGMARRYWMLCLYLAAYSVRSLTLLFLWQHQSAYRTVFVATAPVVHLAECAVVIGVFWISVENYKNFRKIGITGLAVLFTVGICFAWATRNVAVPRLVGIRERMLLWQRYDSLVLVGLLVGIALLLPRSRYLPLRVSAQRAIAILTIDAVGALMLVGISMVSTGAVAHAALWVRWSMTLLPMALRIGTGGLWLVWMTPASDADPHPVVLSQREIDQRREAAMQLQLLAAELRDALRRMQ